MVEVELAADDIALELIHVITLKRQVATQESVKDHSKRPDVRPLAVEVLKNLRRHIVGCSSFVC